MVKILLTGGGTGGHIFPALAVAEELKRLENQEKKIEISYIGPKHHLNEEFKELNIKTYQISSSKLRRYFSIKNLTDIPKFIWSFFQSISLINSIKPDVIFSKGGPGAFPVVFTASLFRIPIIIHESDSIPGITNRLSAIFAKKIAISFESAKDYFKKEKTVLTGNPVRKEFLENKENRKETKKKFGFDPNMPLIFVFGGSQGSKIINDFIFKNLDKLNKITQIYHQVGPKNIEETERIIKSGEKYKFFGNFDVNQMKNALNACDLVISRAGSGAIFEIADMAKPAILIPLSTAANDHQRKNAYEYARVSEAEVIEEKNLGSEFIIQKIEEILASDETMQKMSDSAKKFAKPNAAKKITEEIINLTTNK